MREEPTADDLDDLREVTAAVEEGLTAAFPGLRIVDRELALSASHRADLVCLDAARRLVLVQIVSGRGEEALCAAASALVFLRASGGLLARHLDVDGIADEPPHLVLVSDGFEQDALDRVQLLEGAELSLFDLCELRSARGTSLHLAPRLGARGAARSSRAVRISDFLDAVPEDRRELAGLAVERLHRVDELLEAEASLDAVTWRFGGERVCVLLRGEGELEVEVPADGVHPVAEEGDLDPILDRVLARHLSLLRSERTHSPKEPQRDVEPLGGLAPDSGPLLTPEELEAFRN